MAYRIKIVNLDTDEVMMDAETNCVFAAINDKKMLQSSRIVLIDCDRTTLLSTYTDLQLLEYELSVRNPTIAISRARDAVSDMFEKAKAEETSKTSEKEPEKDLKELFDEFLSKILNEFLSKILKKIES